MPARRPFAALLLLAFLSFFLALGRPAILDWDEGFYAEAAREMVETGDWLTPHFDYEDRWEKPVLYYWLTAATYVVTGPNEASARLWSALSGLGLVLITWSLARRLYGEQTGWLAGSIVATCYGYFTHARLALPDLPLAFCVTLGIWAALRASLLDDQRAHHRDGIPSGRDVDHGADLQGFREAWWALAGLGAGLGFLTKGPVALILPALVLIPIWVVERRSVRLPIRGLALAASIALVVGAPWYVAMWRHHGTRYLQFFFFENNVERFATTAYNDPRAVWFYVPVVLGGLLPWTVYLIAVLSARLFDGREPGSRWRISRDERHLLIWALLPLLFFTVSIGKQPRYVLPVLPPMAILLASALTARLVKPHPGRAVSIATWVTAALFATLAVLLVRAREVFITAVPALEWTAIAVLLVGAGALAAMARLGWWRRLPTIMATCAVAMLLSVQFGALSGVRPEPVEEMAALVAQHRTADEPVGEYEIFVRNLVFYTRHRIERFDDLAAAETFLRRPERVLFVARAEDIALVQARLETPLRTLAQVRYINTNNLKPVTLIAPDLTRDVATVLLVTNR